MLLDGRKPSRKPDAYVQHFASVWRAWLLSRVGTEQAAALAPATEKWFQTRLHRRPPRLEELARPAVHVRVLLDVRPHAGEPLSQGGVLEWHAAEL
jgi:hypothetical protein